MRFLWNAQIKFLKIGNMDKREWGIPPTGKGGNGGIFARPNQQRGSGGRKEKRRNVKKNKRKNKKGGENGRKSNRKAKEIGKESEKTFSFNKWPESYFEIH